jgi:hypothetical protein
MKKIFLLLTIFTMVFTSCEPLEDINAEVDALANPIVGDVVFTLSDDDYKELSLNFGSFSSVDDAKTKVPPFLTSKYPVWGKGSSVLLNYKLYRGNAFSVKNYSLNQANYTASGSTLLGFTSTAKPGDHLPGIIAAKYTTPKEGDYVSAQYFQYTGSAFTITPKISFEENINYGATGGNLTTTSAGSWVHHSGASNQLQYVAENLSMTGYPSSNIGGALALSSSGSEDVNHSFSPIITTNTVYTSALVKLSTVGNGTYFFHLMEEDGSFSYSARVGAKSDGAGKILFGIGATSSSLTYGTTAYNLDTTYLLVTTYNIDTGVSNLHVLTSVSSTEPTTPETTSTGSAGNSANRIGIRQGSGGPTALIDGIRVANTWSSIMSNGTLADEVVGTKVSSRANYTYIGGAWKLPTSGYYSISNADFLSIGVTNFGSSKPADDYLPTFLDKKFPYAKAGDVLHVLYDYVSSSSGAQVRGNSYTKSVANTWEAHKSTIETSLQFGHDGTKWVPDNTIKYTLKRNADYAYMASQLTTAEYAGFIANLANYGDFDYNWSQAQIEYALIIFLKHLDPNAAEGQKYLLTYVVYDNGENDYNKSFIKTNGVWVLNN